MRYPSGLYVSVSFTEESKRLIADLMQRLEIPNPVPIDDLHTTILHSETPVESFDLFASNTQLTKPIAASICSFEVFGQGGEQHLVLKLSAPKLFILHHTIKNATGAVPTFPTYQPHVTLSYDCPDAVLWTDLTPSDFIEGPLEIASIHTKPNQTKRSSILPK